MAKPKSLACRLCAGRLAISKSAKIPGEHCLRRMRCNPWSIKILLFWSSLTTSGKFALSLFDPSWHEGIVGIVAGKLKEDYHCPVAVFAQSGANLKGSIRSIPSVHIKDLLELIDRQTPSLIL
jgi:hypothetical protein